MGHYDQDYEYEAERKRKQRQEDYDKKIEKVEKSPWLSEEEKFVIISVLKAKWFKLLDES